jgi:hypothetical protein
VFDVNINCYYSIDKFILDKIIHFRVIGMLTIGTDDVVFAIQSIAPTVKPSLAQKFIDWDSKYKAT